MVGDGTVDDKDNKEVKVGCSLSDFPISKSKLDAHYPISSDSENPCSCGHFKMRPTYVGPLVQACDILLLSYCDWFCIKINRFKNKYLFHLAKLLGVHTKYRKNIKSVVFGQRMAFSALYYSFKRWQFKKLSMKCIVCSTKMHF